MIRAFIALALVAAGLGTPLPAAGQGPTPHPAAVAGRVTISGKPAAGVPVLLAPADWTESASKSVRSTTDDGGRFRFDEVPPGRYVANVLVPGYAAPNDNRHGRQGKLVALAPGDTVESLELELSRGGVITGRVLDAEDRPVAGQDVVLYLVDESGRRQAVQLPSVATPRTDDRGIYRAFGLAPGRYLVAIGNDGERFAFNPRTFPLTFHPGVSDQTDAVTVDVGAGTEARGIDIVVRAAPKTYAASGRVVDADTGAPIPGIPVMYAAMIDGAMGFVDTGLESGPKGEFRFDGLAPGQYQVISRSGAGSSFHGEPLEFTVSSSDVTGLELRLRTGASISGHAVLEGVTDPELANRLKQVTVFASAVDPSRGRGIAPSSPIAPDGSFRLTGLPEGRIRLNLGAWGEAKGLALLRVERDGVDVTGGIDVVAGEEIANLRLVVGHGTGIVRGEVQVANGELPPGARIMVSAAREQTGQLGRSYPADAQGRFLIDGLLPGVYEVKAVLSRGPKDEKPLTVSKTVTVAEGAPAQVTLTIDLGQEPGGAQ